MTEYNETYNTDETVELQEVLEPYQDETQWVGEEDYSEEIYAVVDYEAPVDEEYSEAYLDGYEEFYGEEYSEEHEQADSESRFRLAMGAVDLISICLGVVVILVLVTLLLALFNWLKTDILHSALLLQSGLQ